MSSGREAPQWFVRELMAFPDFREVRYNSEVSRWEFVFLSAAGRPTSQFWGWFHNPLTGARIEPDPVSGLLPFRDLDSGSCMEALANLKKTFIGNPHDGAGTHIRKMKQAVRFNRDLMIEKRRARAQLLAGIIGDMHTGRDWVKFHPHEKDPRSRRLRAQRSA